MKKLFTLFVLCLMVIGMSAQTISKKAAMQKAAEIFQRGTHNARGGESLTPQLVYTSEMSGVTCFYVFNNPEGGYVILGGDKVARQVLATCSKGQFDYGSLNPSAKWLLAGYAREISATRIAAKAEGDDEGDDEDEEESYPSYPETSWRGDSDIEPLLGGETGIRWSQEAPYNNECPVLKSSGETCATGCVATATAQVLRYFQYPAQATKTKEWPTDTETYEASRTAGTKAYDWENMLLRYQKDGYNDTQAAAVANLMADVGAFCEMQYGPESGSNEEDMLNGLKDYMDYSGEFERRTTQTSEEWEKKAYNSLYDNSPLIYGGDSCSEGGHCFVVDGYSKTDGTFHVNWGWDDDNDGYYALSGTEALTPHGQAGTGGGMGTYLSNHDAIFNLKPNSTEGINAITDNQEKSGTSVRKTAVGGQVVIVKGGSKFNAAGQRM